MSISRCVCICVCVCTCVTIGECNFDLSLYVLNHIFFMKLVLSFIFLQPCRRKKSQRGILEMKIADLHRNGN